MSCRPLGGGHEKVGLLELVDDIHLHGATHHGVGGDEVGKYSREHQQDKDDHAEGAQGLFVEQIVEKARLFSVERPALWTVGSGCFHTAASLIQVDAGVDPLIADVHHKIDDHDEDGEHQYAPLDQRIVPGAKCSDDLLADSRDVEYALHDN